MNYDHSISSDGGGDATGRVSEFESSDAPPPPPPPPQAKVRADFAASAAMAQDILALGTEGDEMPVPLLVTEVPKPRAVPDLDVQSTMPEWTSNSPMAPDVFFASSRDRSKKKRWKITR
jgi:hypothetical protein